MRPNDRRGGGDSLAMSLVTTPAVVLQTYRYSETSKVVRLATRDLGVQSAIAKGALRPKSRFAGAAALAEVMLKMAPPASLPAAYDTLTAALDALAAATPEHADATAVRSMWRLVAVLGFEPSLSVCVRDGAAIEPTGDGPVLFSVADGGVFCPRCLQAPSPHQAPSRLPPQAYRDLLALNDPRVELPALDSPHAAAHRRLVARFVRYHLAEAGSLSALDFWERHAWVPPLAIRTPIPSAAS